MDVGHLLRLKGIIEGSERADITRGGEGLIASYERVRQQVFEALEPGLTDEFEELFPAELRTTGQPWGAQAGEVKILFGQLAGWIGGIIETALLERRIQAEAEAKAKQIGFS